MSITLEVGKFYRDAEGKKRGPAWTDNAIDYPFCVPRDGASNWYSAIGESCNCRSIDIIAEWTDAPTSPVRTVTRKDIVPGVYDIVHVRGLVGETVVTMAATGNAKQLRAAIATLTEIADALEDQQ